MKKYLYILIIIFIFLCVCLFCKGCIDIYENFRTIFPDCSSLEKKLVQIVNQLGQNTTTTKNEILFYIYDNGCVERNFITY